MVTFDARDPGTSAAAWQADPRWGALPGLSLAGVARILVLAAHPDDETLGAGGLIAAAHASGIAVTVVIVTDGAPAGSAPDVAATRRAEAVAAMGALGVTDLRLLGFTDGAVREDRQRIEVAARQIANGLPGALVVAPWVGDGHRDHRVLGEIAVALVDELGLDLWGYPIWLWHWGVPAAGDAPWPALMAFALEPAAVTAKALAVSLYSSQVTGPEPMLHARFLQHFARPAETFVVDTRRPRRAQVD